MAVFKKLEHLRLSRPHFLHVTDKNSCYFQGNLKEKYKELYGKHEINTVEGDKITLTVIPIDDFAVKLKIIPHFSLKTKTEYNDEMRIHLENLNRFTGDEIDISQLIDGNNRVTFIRGIAGMGKSVLAKQLAIRWANGEIYKEFKCCFMIECRVINYLRSKKGEVWKEREIFEEVFKEKFNYDLGDGKGILFVVDGLDELYDINSDDSIIAQLLSTSDPKYSMSKIIITGRPHVEKKLTKYVHEMNGLRRVEIQGLNRQQVNEYIDKFPSSLDDSLYIEVAKDSALTTLSILHVPQFLNTFCCVAILRKGEKIENEAELYPWTLYLLLRQHGSENPNEAKFPKCFERYSNLLHFISSICHQLLTENKVIIERKIKKVIKEMIPGIEKETENFIKSLFVDVSDNAQEKYQFKHLSLMEFLAALHICSNFEDWTSALRVYLENGFIEVSSFFCSLIAGLSSSNIITELLDKVSNLRAFDKAPFLVEFIELLNASNIDEDTKFKRSIDFISYFSTKDFKHKDVILSIISKLHHNTQFLRGNSDLILLNSIRRICKHLVEVCKCTDDEIQKAFENIHIYEFDIQEFKELEGVKYMNAEWIVLRQIKTNMTALWLLLQEGMLGSCERISFVNCDLADDEQERKSGDERQNSAKILKGFGISRCTLTRVSFSDICEFGVISEGFFLRTLEVRDDWWEILVAKITERRVENSLRMKTLNIESCSTVLTKEMEETVSNCTNSKQLFVINQIAIFKKN